VLRRPYFIHGWLVGNVAGVYSPLPTALAIFSFALTLMSGAFLVFLVGVLIKTSLTSWHASESEWPHPESEARGLKLLKEWLSPHQLSVYESNKYFDVVGCDSGKIYRIHHGIQANIDQLDDNGRPICRWCFAPKDMFVTGDVMLAQKIALETYESGALAVANRFSVTIRSNASAPEGSSAWWMFRTG
jgi:hypothetical protein